MPFKVSKVPSRPLNPLTAGAPYLPVEARERGRRA